jgi:hypothetical protein
VRHSRLSAKPHRKYRLKYFDIQPAGYPLSFGIDAPTEQQARSKFLAKMKKEFSWTPQEWKEFREHDARLAEVRRYVTPYERAHHLAK